MSRKLVWLPLALLGVTLAFGGNYAIRQGNDARHDVRVGLAREHVVVSKDAPAKAYQNKAVTSAETAQAQADAIWMHTMKATGDKTYAELKKDDPSRATAKDGAALRTGLELAVMGFGVARLVTGLGWGLFAFGLLLVLFSVAAGLRGRRNA